MKRLLLLVGVLICIGSAGLLIPKERALQTANNPLRVLALVPLSGPSAAQGEWVKQGIKLALKEIQEDHLISLNFEDTAGETNQAIRSYQSSISTRPFNAVITWGSSIGLALTPIVNRHRVIQIGVATATPLYRTLNDFTFRIFPSAEDEGKAMVKFVRSNFPQSKVALLTTTNDYGESLSQAIHAAFSISDHPLLIHETFSPTEKDFRAVLLRLKQRSVQVVLLAAYPESGELIMKQSNELGLPLKFIAASAITSEKTEVKLQGDITIFVPAINPNHSFAKLYKAAYGQQGNASIAYAARAYDAVIVLAIIAKKCVSRDPLCLQKELFNLQEYDGASGSISFDNYGDVILSAAFTSYSNYPL